MHDHGTSQRSDSPKPNNSEPPPQIQRDFVLGAFRVSPDLLTIEGTLGTSTVEAKAMAVLQLLAAHVGVPVSKQDILAEVWEDRYVSDDVVWRAIGLLRRTLGDSASEPRYIATVRGKGYRLLLAAQPVSARPMPKAPAPRERSSAGRPGPLRGPQWQWLLVSLLITIVLALSIRIEREVSMGGERAWLGVSQGGVSQEGLGRPPH